MSNPTRCVQGGSDEACLFIDTTGDGTACLQATFNGQSCQGCDYVRDGDLCTGATTAGYALDCRNVVSSLVDMSVCGDTLSASVAGRSSNDGGEVNKGALMFFIILFCMSMGVRIYAEVRRFREGLDEEETRDLKKTKDSKNKKKGKNDNGAATKERDVDEFCIEDQSNVKGQIKRSNNDKPEEPLRTSTASRKGAKKKRSPTSERSELSNSASTTGSKKKGPTGKNGSKKKGSSSRDTAQQPNNGSRKSNKKAASTSAAFEFDNVLWDQKNKNGKDDASVDPDHILPGDKFEAYNEIKGDSKATALRKFHRKGDWEAIRDFFHKIRRRIIERQHYIGLLVQWIAADWPEPVEEDTVFCTYLDAWNDAEPENLQCNVIRLEVWIEWAWHGRTKAFAHEISPQRVELFYDRMDSGAAELERVLKVTKKKDALVYAAAIKIATGRSDDQSVVQGYMQEVQASNDPANYNFHTRALEYFCEKWHGSHQEMMDYAKWITEQLPDGHPLWILIPVAHYECAALMDSSGDRLSYWHKQHDAIVKSYEKALVGPWEVTVNSEVSPACKKLDAVVRNWFVFALGKCRATELAHRQARVIGKRPIAELPWDEKYTYIRHVKNLGFVVDSESVV